MLRQSDLGQRPGETQPVQQAEVTYRGVQSSAQSASHFCGNLAISRHFIPALREADVPRDAVLALGGWANGRTKEIYGGALKASTLARQIVKVRYPGLDLGVFTCGMDSTSRIDCFKFRVGLTSFSTRA